MAYGERCASVATDRVAHEKEKSPADFRLPGFAFLLRVCFARA
jgi:hypothetical protein